ncbi:MAG TPA: AMP-binding protein [Pseudonocardia sp.]|jgi:crotonobetaine/carnitine-CoA ligase
MVTSLVPRPDFVLPQMVRHRAEIAPEHHLIEPVGAAPITASDFHQSVVRLAHALDGAGIRAGDCVASMLEASPIAIRAWIATAWLRAYEVSVNVDFRGSSLEHALNDSASRLLITTAGCLARIAALGDRLSSLELVVVVGGVGDDPCDPGAPLPQPWSPRVTFVSFEEFIADGEGPEYDGPRESDMYAVNYTSGTTGPAKGVLRGWAGLHASLSTVFPNDEPDEYENPAIYSPWAMFHSSGRISALAAFQTGARLIQRSQFSLTEFWADVTRSRTTHAMLFSVGAKLWQSRSPEWADNTLRRAFVNPLFPEFDEFSRYFDVRVSTAWGMTEIGLPLSAPSPRDWRSCGRVVPGYEVRLVDDDDQEVPRGQSGQLIVRHDRPWHIATRYLGRPEATARAWQNGWFHTGDALREDDEGNFYFVDRMKDYIRVRGHNVSSLEVEREILAHPAVAECACVGARTEEPDGPGEPVTMVGDEEIKVYVVPRDTEFFDPGELFEFVAERLPRQMLPRFIEPVDQLPRTPTMKIKKIDLRGRPHSVLTWDRYGSPGPALGAPPHVTAHGDGTRR